MTISQSDVAADFYFVIGETETAQDWLHRAGYKVAAKTAYLPDSALEISKLESSALENNQLLTGRQRLGGVVVGSLWQSDPGCPNLQLENELRFLQSVPVALDDQGQVFCKVRVLISETETTPSMASRNVDRLFVYGTLREGECRQYILQQFNARSLKQGRIPGQLYNLGEYPGWKPLVIVRGDGRREIVGEVYQLDDIAHSLRRLDEEEEFLGWENASLYSRVLIRCEEEKLMWIYRYEYEIAETARIETGNWLQR